MMRAAGLEPPIRGFTLSTGDPAHINQRPRASAGKIFPEPSNTLWLRRAGRLPYTTTLNKHAEGFFFISHHKYFMPSHIRTATIKNAYRNVQFSTWKRGRHERSQQRFAGRGEQRPRMATGGTASTPPWSGIAPQWVRKWTEVGAAWQPPILRLWQLLGLETHGLPTEFTVW